MVVYPLLSLMGLCPPSVCRQLKKTQEQDSVLSSIIWCCTQTFSARRPRPECPNVRISNWLFLPPRKKMARASDRRNRGGREGPPVWPAHAQTVRSFGCSPLPFFLPSLPPPSRPYNAQAGSTPQPRL